jgi:hypothetical protein
MLHYPKIPSSQGCPGGPCIAFEKIEGTNLHWDWDREFGWHAFGTRRDEFTLTPLGIEQFRQAHPDLAGCHELFPAGLAGPLEKVFRTKPRYAGCAALKAFTEYAGPGSFAGMHCPGEAMELVLFDVEAEGFGMVGPFDFVADFGHLRIPRVVYRGKFSGQLTEDVRNGKFGVAEGGVVKGGSGRTEVWRAKVKTQAYRGRLERAFAGRWESYWE